MATKVLMPKLGLTMTEGTIEEWKFKEGDAVKAGDVLFSVATDKLTNDIESDTDGILLKILLSEGETAPCKSVIAYIGAAGETVGEEAPVAAQAASAASTEPKAAKEEGPRTVLVVGGGPGGYVAAIRAAQLGGKVTLIEKAEIGGTCLNRGCMPTKALLHSAEVYEAATKSASCGIIGKDVQVDWSAVQNNRASVTAKLTSGVKALIKMNKIKLIEGEAVFTGPKTVTVEGKDYSADKIIIAAGSYPIIPGIPGVKESSAVIDSTGALTMDHIPESLLVIGGGVIGLELGSVYNTFGTKVTVVEAQDKLLPLMDAELTAMVRAQLEGKGMEILTGSKVLSVTDGGTGAVVEVECADGKKTFDAEKVLVCVGRGPNTAKLGLNNAGIAKDNGYIKVDDYLETNIAGVYAIGDCNGKLMLAHAAMAMGEAAAENAMGGAVKFDAATSPSCAYVGPEVACIGLTEDAAKAKGLNVKVGRFPTSANGRSLVMGHTDGMIKVVADAKYGEILGVHILAAHATDLIEEAALAMKLEATTDELVGTIHCHPTIAEGFREAVLAVDKKAIHNKN